MPHPAERHAARENRRIARRREMTDMRAADEELGPFLRGARSFEDQRQERALARNLRQALERRAADELGLLHLHRPGGADLGRGAVEIGVETDDEVPLLEPQQLQGVEAVGPQIPFGARGGESIPERRGLARRTVELDRELADEADSQSAAVDAGDADVRDT